MKVFTSSVIAATTFATVVVFSILFFRWSPKVQEYGRRFHASSQLSKKCSRTCVTKECVLSAATILELMDPSTRPCDDFYSYSCSNYLQTRPSFMNRVDRISDLFDSMAMVVRNMIEQIPSNTVDEAANKLKRYYESCMEYDTRGDNLKKLVSEVFSEYGIEGWPELPQNWTFSNLTRDDVLGRWQVDSSPFVDVEFTDNNTLTMSPLSMLSKSDYSSNTTKSLERLRKYRETVAAVLSLFQVDEETSGTFAEEMLHVDGQLVEYKLPTDEKNATELLVSESKWSNVLRVYFRHLGLDSDFSNITLHSSANLESLKEFLDSVPDRVVANYMALRYVMYDLPYFSQMLSRTMDGIGIIRTNPKKAEVENWKRCNDEINGIFDFYLGPLVTSVYISEYMDDSIKGAIDTLFSYVQNSTVHIIRNVPGLESDTKISMINAIRNISTLSNYINSFCPPSLIEYYYQGWKVSDSFLQNYLHLRRHINAINIKILFGSETHEKARKCMDLFVSPIARTYADDNRVILDLGMIRPPNFATSRPLAINHAYVGPILSHEISHVVQNIIDNIASSSASYQQFSKCLISQYSQFEYEFNRTVDGTIKLSENFADNFGQFVSFDALEKIVKDHGEPLPLPGLSHLTLEQTFYLIQAQVWCSVTTGKEEALSHVGMPHSRGDHRVLGSYRNTRAFSDNYHCPTGSFMNPEEKCYFVN